MTQIFSLSYMLEKSSPNGLQFLSLFFYRLDASPAKPGEAVSRCLSLSLAVSRCLLLSLALSRSLSFSIAFLHA